MKQNTNLNGTERTPADQGDTVRAFVPGGDDQAASIAPVIRADGFSALTTDDKDAFSAKDKESWIVATSASSNPLASAFGDEFSGPVVIVIHVAAG